MMADVTDKLQTSMDEDNLSVYPEPLASSHRLATELGVDARNMQVMKASFFAEQDVELEIGR